MLLFAVVFGQLLIGMLGMLQLGKITDHVIASLRHSNADMTIMTYTAYIAVVAAGAAAAADADFLRDTGIAASASDCKLGSHNVRLDAAIRH